MNRYDKMLLLCTSKSNDGYFSDPCFQDDFVYATEGTIALRLKKNLSEGEYEPSKYGFTHIFSQLDSYTLPSPLWFMPDALQAALDKCEHKMDYAQVPCRSSWCENGKARCPTCEHETECEYCSGKGTIPDEDCGKQNFLVSQQVVKVNGTKYRAEHIELLQKIAQLSECSIIAIIAHLPNRLTLFRLAEVEVLLSALRDETDSGTAAEIVAGEDKIKPTNK